MGEKVLIEIQNLSKIKKDVTIIDGLSLALEGKGVHTVLCREREVTLALFDIICGVIPFDGGVVSVFGHDIVKEHLLAKKKLGYISESVKLYDDMSVLELLDFVGSAKKMISEKKEKQIKEALELVGLKEHKKTLVKYLSNFEVAKLRFAIAILGNPSAILINYPFEKFKNNEREELMAIVELLGGVKNVIIATTSPNLVENICDDVIILSGGKCIIHETKDKIIEKTDGKFSLCDVFNALIDGGKEEN